MKKLTGEILEGNYFDRPRKSGSYYDFTTKERIDFELYGKSLNRAVQRRVIWRNMQEDKLVAEFVTVNGLNYIVADEDSEPEAPAAIFTWGHSVSYGSALCLDLNAIECRFNDRIMREAVGVALNDERDCTLLNLFNAYATIATRKIDDLEDALNRCQRRRDDYRDVLEDLRSALDLASEEIEDVIK